jgi:hypothetical protein
MTLRRWRLAHGAGVSERIPTTRDDVSLLAGAAAQRIAWRFILPAPVSGFDARPVSTACPIASSSLY